MSLFPAGWSGVMLAGGVAGVVAWSFGTPMDVIKARLQVDGARGTKRYRGFFHCVTETVRTEGVGVFFRSWGINCLRAVPVSIAVFLTYEVFTGLLKTTPDNVEPPRVGFEWLSCLIWLPSEFFIRPWLLLIFGFNIFNYLPGIDFYIYYLIWY